jgi:hypothetical protein
MFLSFSWQVFFSIVTADPFIQLWVSIKSPLLAVFVSSKILPCGKMIHKIDQPMLV